MDPTPLQPARRPHVLIIGGGFGGIWAAKALHKSPVDITIVDRTNHHLFQPLLYQVATAGLPAPSIAAPIRQMFRGDDQVTTLMAEVSGFDLQARQVRLADGGSLAYDHLIVAAGATHSYFGNDQWAEHAPGLKTLSDAFSIRRRALLAFEAAERADDPVRQRDLMTFVVIGAGPTGVEMAGTLVEIARHTLPGEFRRIQPALARVLLVEGGSRVLQAMPPSLSEKARQQLERLGVEVMLDTKVTAIDADGLWVERGGRRERIDSHSIIWAAGVAASPLARMLGEAAGVACDRAGRVPVEPDLSLRGFPEVSVIGDMAAALSHPRKGEPTAVPGVSPAAKQMGQCAARNLQRRMAGQPTQAFVYQDYGNLATIGRRAAVVDLSSPLGPIRFSGFFAWLFWLIAHVYFLIGFRNRIAVLMDWAWAYFTYERHARVVAGEAGTGGPIGPVRDPAIEG